MRHTWPRAYLALLFVGLRLFVAVAGASAQSVPAVPNPTCVAAFCPSGSLHPNMSIPCSSSGCECWDTCGQGGGSSRSSGGNAAGSRALTAAIVAMAKAAFLIAAPGHATEAFGRSSETSQQAAAGQREDEQARAARARRGVALAAEAEAFANFQRALRRKESDAHRHLLPLFRATPLGPPMSRRDAQAQLRCVQAALSDAVEAMSAGVPGDISFLEARQAADIAAGAWASGAAPSDCAAATAPAPRPPFASYTPEQRQRFLIDLSTQLQSTLSAQADLDQQEAKLLQAQKEIEERRQKLLAEQEQQRAAAAARVEQAQREAEDRQRALDQALAIEPPPAPLQSSKRPATAPPPATDPEDDLLLRLLRAKAQADAQVEATRSAMQQAQDDAARQRENLERSAEAQLAEQAQRLRTLREERVQTLGKLNQDFGILGLPGVALPPGAGSPPATASPASTAPPLGSAR